MSGSTTPVTIRYTGASVTYTVPTTGTYYITAFGAQGGPGLTTSGGLGAEIGGEVTLTAGEALTVAIGGQGQNGGFAGGGGGGSFVVDPSNTPLVVAGGGGGGNFANGEPGQTGTSGSTPANGGAGGSGGAGGGGDQVDPNNIAKVPLGGGGGGFSGSGSAGAAGGGGGGGGFSGLAGGKGSGVDPLDGHSGDGGFGGGGGSGSIEGGAVVVLSIGGAGGGGGYSGGGGGFSSGAGGGYSGGGGGSFDGGTDQLLVGGENSGNGLVTITQLFASTIAVTGSGQTTTSGTTAVPLFAAATITDPNGANPAANPANQATTPVPPDETVTVTPSPTTIGTLSDSTGGTVNSSTGVYTASGTAAQVDADLVGLQFTPASGQSGTTTFSVVDTNWAGLTSTPGTTSVTVTVPLVASTITVPASDQSQTSTGLATVTPFKGVSITDPNPGTTSETVTVTPSTAAIGTLSDPSAGSDGSTVNSSTGAITLKGSAGAVTTALDALTFTPAYGQSGQTTFTIADTNSANLTSTPGTAAVTVTLPTLTTAQLQQVGKDLLQFYTDSFLHKSTTADASKLASDFTSLDISQSELGQLLGQTLTSATLAGTTASTLGTDIAAKYYPKITADLAHGGQGLASDLTSMLVTTAGAGADDLLRVHTGQSAATALTATVADFKLA